MGITELHWSGLCGECKSCVNGVSQDSLKYLRIMIFEPKIGHRIHYNLMNKPTNKLIDELLHLSQGRNDFVVLGEDVLLVVRVEEQRDPRDEAHIRRVLQHHTMDLVQK